MKIVFTDLDGTLLNSESKISDLNLKTLKQLGEKNIIRVIATGRNLLSLRRVIPDEFPVDYVIFSTGAGILDWKSGKIIKSWLLSSQIAANVIHFFKQHLVDFMIHDPIPDNHRFAWFSHGKENPDFFHRISIYEKYTTEWNGKVPDFLTQIIGIQKNAQRFADELRSTVANIHLVRATSPLDHETTWLEVFARNVSKGHAADWLCQYLDISLKHSVSIGNDYNDLDLLKITGRSFVVANAPLAIRNEIETVADHNHNGFTEAVGLW